MTQAAYPVDGLRRDVSLFPFDARGQRNGKTSASVDTRRLQQIQKELRQLPLAELRELRDIWVKPPLSTRQWVRELMPYLDGLIKERTPAIPLPKKQRETAQVSKPITQSHLLFLIEDARREVLVLRKELNAVIAQFAMALPSVERTSKPLPPPRQHAKGKKRRLNGPVGELAAVTRPWLDYGVAHPGREITVFMQELRKEGIDPKRFQSSLSASASYFYGRRSMHTRLVQHILGGGQGVAFTFVGNPKPIRPLPQRSSTVAPTIDQSTPT